MQNKKMCRAVHRLVFLIAAMSIFTGTIALSYGQDSNKPQQSAGFEKKSEEKINGIEAFVKGQYEFKDVKLLKLSDEKGIWKVDWKHSQIGGKVSSSLAGKEDGNSLKARILGPAQVSLQTLDGKDDDSLFLLLTIGHAYCVHPSMYQKNKLQFAINAADLNKAIGENRLIISSVENHPEVIHATGMIPHIARGDDSNPMHPQIIWADPAAMFLPGIIWTVKQPTVLLTKKDDKPQKITMEPGKYKLDENGIPQRLK